MNKLNINKMKILFSFSLLVGQIMKASTLDFDNHPDVNERIQEVMQEYEYEGLIDGLTQIENTEAIAEEVIIKPSSLFGCFYSKSSISLIEIFDC